MKKDSYISTWFRDFWGIFTHELKLIFSDSGVMIIFFLAGLAYPLLYNVMYLNGILNETPIAVVDNADCSASRRFAREVDATRECAVKYHCINVLEAQELMKEGKIRGYLYFPSDYGDKLARLETATLSVYADMSSFLYYKNILMASNMVMLNEVGSIQMERYAAAGFSGEQAASLVQAIPYLQQGILLLAVPPVSHIARNRPADAVLRNVDAGGYGTRGEPQFRYASGQT